jgi:hypothetical protein
VDKVRVLKWVRDINGWLKAIISNGTWWAHDDGHWRLAGGQWSGQVSDGDLSSAQDICEADYIARCSEFLRVAGPGECVVKVEDVIEARRILTNLRQRYGSNIHREPVDDLIESLTAAIDAARKEGGK